MSIPDSLPIPSPRQPVVLSLSLWVSFCSVSSFVSCLFRFYRKGMSDCVCSSLSDLLHSAGQSLGLSILLQERLFANGVTDEELVSQIYRQLVMLSSVKTSNPINKQVEELNTCFSEEDILIANRHLKRCSTALIIREMQIKTAVRYHLKPARIATIKKKKNPQTRWQRRCGKKRTCNFGGNVNWYRHYGEQYGDSFKNKK